MAPLAPLVLPGLQAQRARQVLLGQAQQAQQALLAQLVPAEL